MILKIWGRYLINKYIANHVEEFYSICERVAGVNFGYIKAIQLELFMCMPLNYHKNIMF